MTRTLKYFGTQLCLHSAEAHCTDVCDRALIRTNKRTVSYNDNGTCFSLVVVSVGNAEEKCHLPLRVEKLSRSSPCCASSQRGVFVCNLWHIHLVSKKSVQENTSKVPKLHTRQGRWQVSSVFFFFFLFLVISPLGMTDSFFLHLASQPGSCPLCCWPMRLPRYLFFYHYIYLLCVWSCTPVSTGAVWDGRSEDHSSTAWVWGNQTQVVRFSDKYLYSLSCLVNPKHCFCRKEITGSHDIWLQLRATLIISQIFLTLGWNPSLRDLHSSVLWSYTEYI